MRMIRGGVRALALVLSACGADAEPETPARETPAETTPASTTPASTTTRSASSRASASTELDPSLPEYQGDHSLPGDPTAGEVVYRASCLACHGANGTGNGGMTGADFVHDRRRLARNNEVLLRSIRDGVPNMPPMPAHRDLLEDQQMRDVLAYVRATFGTPDPS